MGTYLFRRIVRSLLCVWFVVTIVFFITRFTGDPTEWILSDEATDKQREILRVELGLTEPVLKQYISYMTDILRGDFGKSFFERRPVIEVFMERLPATLKLGVLSLFLAVVIGIPLGVIAATKRNSPLDRFLMTLCVLGFTIPSFVIGIGLILIFSLTLMVLPSGGFGGIQYYIMPVITLSAMILTSIARLTRSSMLDVLQQDYIRTARAKGVPEGLVIIKHGLRNALIPVVTILALQLGRLIAGAVVVETVFAWPGVGRLLVNAALTRDFPILQFGIFIVAISVLLANYMVDVSYLFLDPRTRSE